ncbi:LysE family translocator [Marinimicrococcus flavescens]|uniref:LysE family translocator n=1 Tax=Marinimicrococcus flavescens TaxID=3031815 RepID=A0AAP3XPZ4_9PROT|nr:LysE family translocator [Marinimicrococcus flavescens]
MSLETWLVYCAAALGLSLTPGPNGLLALTHGMRFGLGRTVFTVLGGVCGFTLLIAASLAGLGALLAASEQAFTLAKWAGAAYLVYLGIRTWQAPPPAAGLAAQVTDPGERRAGRLFRQGLLVALSNPKALLFFAAFLPQFMTPGASLLAQLAVLGGTFAAVELLFELVLAGMAQRVAPWIVRKGRLFNRAAGVAFVGIGAALATTSRN